MFVPMVGVALALTCALLAYLQWCYQYWHRRGVPTLPTTQPFGHFGNPFNRTETVGLITKHLYDATRAKKWRHIGIYSFITPSYMPVDPVLLKLILTKDFPHFVDRGMYHNEKTDPISAHVFAIGGPKWRSLRSKLTPTFTSGKMRTMFPILVECVVPLELIMERKEGAVDIKEVLGCFTTDIIGSCAFGLDFNTFREEESPFRVYGKKFFVQSEWEQVKMGLATNFQDLARFLGYRAIKKDISDFFTGVVRKTVDYRLQNNHKRPDFIQLLIDMMEGEKNDNKTLSFEEIVAQAFIFFLAGFETSSTTMTFTLYELAKHQEIQGKVREEIVQILAKYDGKITYEAIQEMKYMNQVIDEALRKYPPLPLVFRNCVQDYQVPGEGFTIAKGTNIIIPIMGLQNDAEYFPAPEIFDPERFSDENRERIQPYSYMPFGEGPRVCMGIRFGMMQSKVGLAALLNKYQFSVNDKTKEPLTFQLSSFILAAEGEIWLNAHKL